jgi:hypothetical protein
MYNGVKAMIQRELEIKPKKEKPTAKEEQPAPEAPVNIEAKPAEE